MDPDRNEYAILAADAARPQALLVDCLLAVALLTPLGVPCAASISAQQVTHFVRSGSYTRATRMRERECVIS